MGLDLTKVENFGEVDAEGDGLLAKCFQDHDAFRRVLDNRSFLIIGRKGSGKTAIFKRLISGLGPDRLAEGHTFEDYPWEHHDLQASTGVPEARRYIHSWKYFILMAVARILLKKDNPQPWRDDVRGDFEALRAFVKDSYGTDEPVMTNLFRPPRELRISGGVSGVARLDVSRIPIADLPRHIQGVNAVVQAHVLNSLNPYRSYYVCFDQLDIGFSMADPADSQRLIGLLLAARDLFRAAKEAGKRLNVVVFLRDDIYNELHFEDKNKITQGLMSQVEWSEGGDGLTLRGLMESRFAAQMPDQAPMAWRQVFNEEEPINNQAKYRYMCDRTFLRPRDMIQYCNEVLNAHRVLRRPPDERFSTAAVAHASRRYSNYLRQELDDEIIRHVPDYATYLDVLTTIGSESFTFDTFETAWNVKMSRRPRLLTRRTPSPDPNVVDAQTVLEQLFRFSVIGYVTQRRDSRVTQTIWRYQKPDAILNVDGLRLRVHPGLTHALHLTD